MGFLNDIHHMVYVVADLQSTMDMFRRVFKMEPSRRLTVESTGQDIVLYEMESGATIEIIRPLREDTPWAAFLKRHGDGIQLVGYAVGDIKTSLADLESRGTELVNREARTSAIGWTVANISPSSTNGLSFQLFQPAPDQASSATATKDGKPAGMLIGVHHVAYVVADLDKTIEMLGRVFGMKPSRRLIVERAGQEVALFDLDSGAILEVIRPLHEDTPWADFISRHGDGVQHIGYAVRGINEKLAELDSEGVKLSDRQARVSGVGWTVASVDPESTNGLRFQLVEP